MFDRFVRFLIQGNVLRGEVYPLSVAAERTQQAISVIEVARAIGAGAVAHGSTGAGNDQVRFDVAFRVLAAGSRRSSRPIRDEGLSARPGRSPISRRAAFRCRPRRAPTRSIAGSGARPRAAAGPTTPGPARRPSCSSRRPTRRRRGRSSSAGSRGCRSRSTASRSPARTLVQAAGRARRAPTASGRGIHVGETALGIKGRIGFEAGAALLLIAAHRELEKLVLTKWQAFWKDQLGRFYGDRLHEGQYFDPALRDIEALLTSSQQRVTGETRVRLAPGRFQVVGARSPYSMMDRAVATYGEENRLWTGEEARAFAPGRRDSGAAAPTRAPGDEA